MTRHAVLPVLACSEIIMSQEPPAQLGKVADAEHPLERLDRLAYDELANQRYPSVLIHKMYDAGVEVLKGRDGLYHDANEKPTPKGVPVSGLSRGETVLYSFAQARDLGLCQPIPRHTIDEVRERYQLPAASLYPALDRITAWRFILRGPINGEMKERVKRRVRQALGQKANLLILELACGGGESEAAHELAVFLTELNDNRRDPVETIAYVTGQARDTAAFLAFACNKIVMQREIKKDGQLVQEGAILGGFERYIGEHPQREAVLRRNLADIAARKHYPAILAEGMLDRDLHIVAVESNKEESARKYISDCRTEGGPGRQAALAQRRCRQAVQRQGREAISHADGGPGPPSRRGARGGQQF